ncbi:kinase-like protein [Coprinopsis marcescibilis]|uniref:Kinase-like protein n=1 Tax=Coprinopsis marcescibilis TaxID=230819 RepID=A0A5C3KQ24_COPMA|nr:kinase-like protein [Coprinopsis marcescibilis]
MNASHGGIIVDEALLPIPSAPRVERSRCSIGHGSFSDAYKAVLIHIGRPKIQAVVKLPRIENHGRESDIRAGCKATLHEARILKALNHQNIVRIYGIVADDDISVPGLVMEYVPQNLNEYAASHMDSIPALLGQMFEAVSHIHSCDIVHGDLNPGNVRVRASGVVALVDFGLSRVSSGESNHKTISNLNPRFAAPEILMNADEHFWPTKESDIYTLSMTVLQIMSRTPGMADGKCDPESLPFKNWRRPGQLTEYVIQGGRPDLSLYENVWHNEPVKKILKWCWNADPLFRPSIQQIIAAWSAT